jgi:hypothetical protein
MAQIVKHRRSAVTGKKPLNSQLELGEFSINTTDGKVFIAKSGSLGPSIEELIITNTVNTGSVSISGSFNLDGNQSITGALLVGMGSFWGNGNDEILHVENSGSFNIAHFDGNDFNYAQINVKNHNSGPGASGDIVVTADNGTEDIHYVDLGINSSNYTGGFVGHENDSYLINAGKDMYVGTIGGVGHPNTKLNLFAQNLWETPQIVISGSKQVGFNTSSVSDGYVYEFSGSVKLDNELNVDGSVTASYFVGDGSQLTNINATTHLKVTGSNGLTHDFDLFSPITIDGTNGIIVEPYMDSIHLTIGTITGSLNVDGPVTASYFVGDGSGLTNLPAAANFLYISGSDGQNTTVDLLNSFLAITGSGMVTTSIVDGGIEIYVPYVQGGGGGVSAIYIADQGNLIGTSSYFDFNGAGVTTTINNGTASVYIPGGGGGTTTLSDGSYVFLEQTTPSTGWTFNHNLSQRYPIFQVYDLDGKVLLPKEIITIDANNALITFPSLQTGRVIASLGTGPAGVTQYFDAATTWTLNHNMGADYPIVTIWDLDRNIIFPQKIESVNANTVKVYFSEPVAGHLNVAKGGHIIQGSVAAGNVDFSGTQIVSSSIQIKNLGFATTGSNYFKGNQIISGSLSLNHSKIGDACVTTSDVATIFSLGGFSGAIFDYVVNYGMNMRAGTITAVWNGFNSSINETSTTDLGNTDAISFEVSGTGDLIANVTDYNNWEITAMYRALGCNSGTPTTPTPTPTESQSVSATPTQTPTPSSSYNVTSTPVTSSMTPTPTPTVTPTSNTPAPTPSSSYTSIGTANKVGATSCGVVGTTPTIYLDSTDYTIYTNNGGCLSNGVNTVSTIRNSDGTAISGTFYFTWFGSSCSTTTFKSTNGILTINPTQC